MPRGSNVCSATSVLLVLLELAASAMVLPRPPSSPNHIRQDQELSARKALAGKSLLHGDTNVERPDTGDFRLLEIELRSTDEMVDPAANLQGLMRAMLKQQQQQRQTEQLMPNDSYPNAEVMPHSIVGVRDMMGGASPNYRLEDTFVEDDKRVLLSPPKLQSLDEKLYYLKSGRPKVYVNVRGHSGSFGQATVSTHLAATPSDGALGYLKVTRPFDRQTDWKARDKKARPPKKFVRRVVGASSPSNDTIRAAAEQIRTTRRADDDPSSTTVSSMVTSSELPKQIPAPPSKVRAGRILMAQTTPVQRYALRRTDILPGYGFSEEE